MYRPSGFTPAEFTEYYSPDGQLFRFENSLTRFLMTETGLGMPPIKYITQTGPFQHGESIFDYRLQPRVIQLLIRERACSRAGYWANRANILNLLRPNRQLANSWELGTLVKKFKDGSKRAIKVLIEQGPEFAARDTSKWDEWAFTEALRFIAPDPTFYDPTPGSVVFSYSVEEPAQIILPFSFSASSVIFSGGLYLTLGGVINYPGTWLAYPTITLIGPINDPIITNVTTGRVLQMNYHVAALEVVTINLEYGYKTAISSINGNIIGYFTGTSDIAEFAIEPDPVAPLGVNTIEVSGDEFVPGQTSVTISYNTRYIGI